MKNKNSKKRVLLINPWIHDFAAYDYWARPIGLLYIASILRYAGIDIDFLDCLDRHHPLVSDLKIQDKNWGTGKYFAEEITKPVQVKWMKRKFKRYGIPFERVKQYLESIQKPDIIFLTTRMTYWYTAVKEMAELCRDIFPEIPLILGGTYATLLPEHAQNIIKPDVLIKGEAEMQINRIFEKYFGLTLNLPEIDMMNLDSYPFPASDLSWNKDYYVIITSRGCPMACTYCASKIITKHFRRRSAENVFNEVKYLYEKFNAVNIAFYDDALLFNPDKFIKPFLREIIKYPFRNLKFHVPNGISCADIDDELAELLKSANFESIRLSLETININRLKSLNRKNTPDDFLKAIRAIRKVGYTNKQIGVYLLAGLPGQSSEEIDEAMKIACEEGGTPQIAEYSPIPGTFLWDDAIKNARIDIKDEPIYHNCSVYFYLIKNFDPYDVNILRRRYRK